MAEVARDRNPGIARLAALVAQHGEALEADLAFRGLDLRDLRRRGSGMTWRRLRVLISGLPPESLTLTALRNATPPEVMAEAVKAADPGTGRWSQDQMLAAAQFDVLRLILHVLAAAHGAKPGKAPLPMPRPGITAPKSRRTSAEDRRRVEERLRPKPKPNPDGR